MGGVIILNIIVFDNNEERRDRVIRVIRETEPNAYINAFETIQSVLKYAGQTHPQVAFISMENVDGSGYFLAKELKKISPRTNVVAVAQQCRFMQELMTLRVSGYVTDELTKDIVADELANLRYECSNE